MVRAHAAEERVTYAVTSRNKRRCVASGVLRVSPTQLCGKHISATVNDQASGVFYGSGQRLYNEDLIQLEFELSRVPELAVAKENWES
jgi:hypothetical protein